MGPILILRVFVRIQYEHVQIFLREPTSMCVPFFHLTTWLIFVQILRPRAGPQGVLFPGRGRGDQYFSVRSDLVTFLARSVVLIGMALLTDQAQIAERQRHLRVRDVGRCYGLYVVHYLPWRVDPAGQAVFAEIASARHERSPAALPLPGLVKGPGELPSH